MGFFKKTEPDNPYIGLRQLAIDIKPADLGIMLDHDEQVFAAVTDIPVTNGIATLACFSDGTVSLYLSSGGGFLGVGQEYEEVKQAGISFLVNSGQTLKYLERTDNFDLPKDEDSCVYLKVRNGTYKAKFNMSKIESYDKPIQFLNFLIQNTLTNLREKVINK